MLRVHSAIAVRLQHALRVQSSGRDLREVNGKFHCYMLHHQQKTAEKTLTFGGLIDLCLDPFNQPNSPLEPARNGQGMHLACSSRSSCECTGYGFWKTREQKYVVQAFLLINRQQPKQGRLQFLTTEEPYLETIFRKRKALNSKKIISFHFHTWINNRGY